jgi:hypothetical protein
MTPVGDIAEWIVSKILQLTLTPMSNRSHDAIDASDARYHIKARWCPSTNRSKQLGVSVLDDAFRDFRARPIKIKARTGRLGKRDFDVN